MDKEKLNKFINTYFAIGTPIMLLNIGAKIYSNSITNLKDNSKDNTIGYDAFYNDYNFKVHNNNFVMLHVKKNSDINYLKESIIKCNNSNISLGIILDTEANNFYNIYSDIDLLQAIVNEHKIDYPIYCNIDNIMENKDLNSVQKQELIKAFVDKSSRSDMAIGIYGKDSNLCACNDYVYDLSSYDCFLVQDKKDIQYKGKYNIVKDLKGNIKAKTDLSKEISRKNLNQSSKLVLSRKYKVQKGETYFSISLKFGLSENDLREYNDIDELKENDIIMIPNYYKTITDNDEVEYSYAVARGIDISDYQTEIDWDTVSKTSDYVIVEVGRSTMTTNKYLGSVRDQISNALSHNLSLGLYFCIESEMPVDMYREQLNNYLKDLEEDTKDLNINKNNIPIFIDFETYSDKNDYYELMECCSNICKSYGYNKIGIYGNNYTLTQISSSMKKNGENIELSDTEYYVWKSGGSQYSANENATYDDVTLSEIEEVNCISTPQFTPAMQQVTNVCTDTGAKNDQGHCDVSFLYNNQVFGDDFSKETDEFIGTIQLSMTDYSSVPWSSIAGTISTVLAVGYAICACKVIGEKVFLKIKNKKKNNNISGRKVYTKNHR